MIIGINGEIGSGKDTVGKIIQLLASDDSSFKNWAHVYPEEAILDWNGNFDGLGSFQNKKFADKLKDFVCVLIGCTRRQLEDHDFKNIPLGDEWNKLKITYSDGYDEVFGIFPYDFDVNELEDAKGRRAYIHSIEIVQLTPRLLMQLIGTECGRDIIHPDIWVNGLFNEYKIDKITNEYPDWIITDLRFPNELARIKKYEGVSIKVVRPKEASTGNQNIDFILNKTPNFGTTPHYSEIALNNARFDYTIINDGSLIDLKNKVDIILKDIKYFEKFLNYI